jgi:hypothetical protein
MPYTSKSQEGELRYALHQIYETQLYFCVEKVKRIRELLKQIRSPGVELKEVFSSPMIDEDGLRWLEEDFELFTMSHSKRPRWVKRFPGK